MSDNNDKTLAVFDADFYPALVFVRALALRDVRVIVYSPVRSGMARWSRFTSECRACPDPEDRPLFLPWLRAQLRSKTICLVAPTSDRIAFYCAELRDEFSPEAQKFIPSLAMISQCLDKARFFHLCRTLAVGTPDSAAPASLEEALEDAERLGYPLVLKPKSHIGVGMQERGCIIENEAQLRERFKPYRLAVDYQEVASAFPQLAYPLMQQFVSKADEQAICISGFYDARTGVRAITLSQRCMAWPPDIGVSVEQISIIHPRAEQETLRLLEGLHYSGLFGLEMLVQGEQLLAIDFNPRGFGFMAFNVGLGHDLPWLWYQAVQGHGPASLATPPAGQHWVYGFPYHWRMLWALILGPQRGTTLHRWVKVIRAAPMPGLFSLRDPLPFFFNLFGFLRHPRSLLRLAIRKQMALRRQNGGNE